MKRLLLVVLVLLLIPITVSAQDGGGEDIKPADYDPITYYGDSAPIPIPNVVWKVTWISPDRTKFRLIPKTLAKTNSGCIIREIEAHCLEPGVASPSMNQEYKLRSDGDLGTGDGSAQKLRPDKITQMNCSIFIPFTIFQVWRTPTPVKPCCTTCDARFRKLEGSTKLREWFYKFTDVTNGNSPLVLTGVRLTDPQVFRFDTLCENGECKNMFVTLDGVDKTEDSFRDCNGQMGCAWFQYNQAPRRACFNYYDRGCLCKVCAEITDPEFSVDNP